MLDDGKEFPAKKDNLSDASKQNEKYFRLSLFKMMSLESRNMSIEENLLLLKNSRVIFFVIFLLIIIALFLKGDIIAFVFSLVRE